MLEKILEQGVTSTLHFRREGVLKRLLCVSFIAFSDLLTFLIALQLGILLRTQVLPWIFPSLLPSFELEHYLDFWWMPTLWLLFLGIEGLYTQRRTYWEEVRALWKAATLAMLTIFAVVALGKLSSWVSRPTLTFAWVALLALSPVSRSFIKRLLFRLGLWRKNVLILGAARTGQLAFKALHRECMLGYQVVGFLDDDPEKQGKIMGEFNGMPVCVLGSLKQASLLITAGLAEEVVVAMPGLSEEKLLRLVEELQKCAATVKVIPNVWSLPVLSLKLDGFLHDRLFMITLPYNLSKPWNRMLKRGFDLLLATGLLVALSPVIVLSALAIKLTSRGPIIYKHLRIGQGGRRFYCYKFRTMVMNADVMLQELLERDPIAKWEFERFRKLRNDPRVTPVGRVLRKLSIDEIPQLFNVLKGEMSLIGPRPVMNDELEKYYSGYEDWYFSVRPGITGLWQVSGKSDLGYGDRVAMDIWYIRNWSLWLDVIIAIRTAKTVLGMKGAY
jgi:Undecaprenyl-phosphate galactose phosphotransferase WbaP